MDYIITITTSVASAMLVFVLQAVLRENHKLKNEREQKQEVKEKALEEGVLCLLRAQLIEYHTKYMESDYISTNGFQNWMLMYKAYKALGGNGLIEHMKEEIEGLHIGNHRKEVSRHEERY